MNRIKSRIRSCCIEVWNRHEKGFRNARRLRSNELRWMKPGGYSLRWPIQGGSLQKGNFSFRASGIKRVAKSLISVCKIPKRRDNRCIFAARKVEKTFWVCDFFMFQRQCIKRDKGCKVPSLRAASSPGHSGGGTGKGRRACNYVSAIWINICIEKVDAKCWLAELTLAGRDLACDHGLSLYLCNL